MKTHRIAHYPGDGIGVDVTDAAITVLHAAARRAGGFQLEFTRFDWGVVYYERHGRVAPADNVATLDNGFFDVQGANDTNRADLFVFGSDERMVVTARLDNLGKGAAGAAVQCMNVHLGVDEATSLHVEAPIPAAGAEHAVREAAPGFAS